MSFEEEKDVYAEQYFKFLFENFGSDDEIPEGTCEKWFEEHATKEFNEKMRKYAEYRSEQRKKGIIID